MDNRIILCIVEGEVTEPQVLDSLKHILYGIITDDFKIISYKTNIYQLYKELMEDEDDLDLIGILKEKDKSGHLSKIKRKDVSDIFLFFDYDGHDSKADDKVIFEMVNKFSNETENGKLYISYPMVESLKHLKSNNWDSEYNDRTIEKKDFSSYKTIVASDTCYPHIDKYNFSVWQRIIKQNMNKVNFLMTGVTQNPEFEKIDNFIQRNIFRKQLENHIEPHSEVSVLSGFPFFVIEYIKKDVYDKYFK